jgi:hypothetical protein
MYPLPLGTPLIPARGGTCLREIATAKADKGELHLVFYRRSG